MRSVDVVLISFRSEAYAKRLFEDLPRMTVNTVAIFPFDNTDKQMNLSIIKNTMAAQGKGDYILFATSDVVISPGWDERLIVALEENPEMAAAQAVPVGDRRYPQLWKGLEEFGPSDRIPSSVEMARVAEHVKQRAGFYVLNLTDKYCPLYAPLMGRDTWEKYKGFDERFRFFGADNDFIDRFTKDGRTVAVIDNCPFYHGGGTSIRQAKRPGDLNVAEEHRYKDALKKGGYERWHLLPDEERASVRDDPNIRNLALLK